MEHANKIIAVAIVLVVGLGIVAVTVSRQNSIWCGLVDEKPASDLSKLPNLASSDLKALVKFAGYINYEIDSTYRFVPLRVDSVNVTTLDDGDHLLVVLADCARLSFTVQPNKVKSVHVDLALPSKKVRVCASEEPNFAFDDNQHYACLEEHERSCNSTESDGSQTRIAWLVFEALEFELNGDPMKVERHEFSTFPSGCPGKGPIEPQPS